MPVFNAVVNQKNVPAMLSDPIADRPAATFPGRVFFNETAPYGIYKEIGGVWVNIADTGAGTTGTLQTVTQNGATTTILSTFSGGIVLPGTTAQYVTGNGSLATFPTNVSAFVNDAGYVTASSPATFTNKSGNISQWTNDVGYITSVSDSFIKNQTTQQTGANFNIDGNGTFGGNIVATGNGQFNGTLGIGNSASASNGILVRLNLPFTNVTCISNTSTINSATLTVYTSFQSNPSTAAVSFTLPSLVHYSVRQVAGSLGAGSAITSQTGFDIPSGFTLAGNNYGFRNQVAAGSGRWGLYFDGTVTSYHAGNLQLGSTTATAGTEKLQVSGSISVSAGVLLNTISGVTSIGAGAGTTYQLNVAGTTLSSQTNATINTNSFSFYGSFVLTASGAESTQLINASYGAAWAFQGSSTYTPNALNKNGGFSSTLFMGGTGLYNGLIQGVYSSAELSNSGNINGIALLRAVAPIQQNGQTAFTGTVTDVIGLQIDDISASGIAAQFTNKYAVKQLGANDRVYFAGKIEIGNTVTAAIAVASTNKVAVLIGGVQYYLLATT